MKNYISQGTLVMSKQGYDKNKIYVVKEVDEKYAYLIDGITRHFYNAKKKNLKHLMSFSIICKLDLQNIKKTNNEVCKLIASFNKALKKL